MLIECIKLIENQKGEHADLYISANYNLGVLYFVTDQYQNAKIKLSIALNYKKDFKAEEYTELTAIIYETIGEVELEYKQYQKSYENLKAAYDIRMKLPNLDDKKSKVKINIMLDYLYQNLKNENHKNLNKKQSKFYN